MMDCTVVILATVDNPILFYAAEVAVRTCQASTGQPIYVLCNNSNDVALRERFQTDCGDLGVTYEYWPGAYHMNRMFNHVNTKLSTHYVAYCNQDVIFYQGWLSNLITQWEKQAEYWMVVPYNQGSRPTITQKRVPGDTQGIVDTPNHATGVIVLRRGFAFDETFADWEQDADMHYYAGANRLKIGVCLSSRVDHFEEIVRKYGDIEGKLGVEGYAAKASAALKAKWNL